MDNSFLLRLLLSGKIVADLLHQRLLVSRTGRISTIHTLIQQALGGARPCPRLRLQQSLTRSRGTGLKNFYLVLQSYLSRIEVILRAITQRLIGSSQLSQLHLITRNWDSTRARQRTQSERIWEPVLALRVQHLILLYFRGKRTSVALGHFKSHIDHVVVHLLRPYVLILGVKAFLSQSVSHLARLGCQAWILAPHGVGLDDSLVVIQLRLISPRGQKIWIHRQHSIPGGPSKWLVDHQVTPFFTYIDHYLSGSLAIPSEI